MMKQLMFIGALAIALGAGNVWAQQPGAAGAAGAAGGHTAPKTQPTTAPDPTIAAGDLALGSVSLGKAVKAGDWSATPAGYEYRTPLTLAPGTGLRAGLNVHKGRVTCREVAEALGYDALDALDALRS